MGSLAGAPDLTLQGMLGSALAPLAWAIRVPWQDARTVGELIGMKTVLNEFVAFRQLADHLQGIGALAPRSMVIASYALAGFANFGSIAMQIAGMGELAPSTRSLLAQLGPRAMPSPARWWGCWPRVPHQMTTHHSAWRSAWPRWSRRAPFKASASTACVASRAARWRRRFQSDEVSV